MLSQSATLELVLAVVVLFAIFYAIARLNRRRRDDDDVLPVVDEIDGLAEIDTPREKSSVSAKDSWDEGIVSPPKVIAPADVKAKVEGLRARTQAAESSQSQAQAHNKPAQPLSTVIAIHVMARAQHVFYGDAIQQVLTQAGLHYGDLRVFHRYAEHNEQQGQIIFSVASAVNPGTLMVHLGQQFSCPGLTFFLDFAKQKNAVTMFQLMLNTARGIAQALDGELRDEQRKTWSLTAEQSIRRRIQRHFMQTNKSSSMPLDAVTE